MKKIALYLPQFHAIPENDAWWGEGFTEWTNVSKSKPQFIKHVQPEIPYGKNYYNLLDENVQENQAKMAKKYGVDGFCYYHYWFEGKLLLEKPMENMLKNPKVDIPFCICWANETWARTWDGKEQDILIKQNYNETKDDWKAHFNYFLPFFKDDRYIKHDGKPMLLIYKPHLILNCKEMLEYWNKLAIEAGFNGMYMGFQHHSAFDHDMDTLGFDFGVEFEPFYTVREINKEQSQSGGKFKYAIKHPGWAWRNFVRKIKKGPRIYDYDMVWRRILKRTPERKNVMPGAFAGWDNTPRKGQNADVFFESTPQKFEKYFEAQLKHAKEVYDAEYIFINAWNEWAEGAHLEPDEHNGFGYLEAFKKAAENRRNENAGC